MPLTVEGQDDCVVGRIREDLSHDARAQLLGRGRSAPQGRGDQRRADRRAARRRDREPVADRPRRAARPARPPAGLRRRGLPRLAGPAEARRRSRGASSRRCGRWRTGPSAWWARVGPTRASTRSARWRAWRAPRHSPPGRSWPRSTRASRPTSACWRLGTAPPGFDARRAARLKRYGYLIETAPVAWPLSRGRAWHLGRPLDPDAMGRAAAPLRGTHDFAAFCAAPGRGRDPACTVRAVRVVARGHRVGILMSADAFLHHMVRNVVGTLVEVGLGRRPIRWVAEVLAGRDRRRGGPDRAGARALPAPGALSLARVSRRPPRSRIGASVARQLGPGGLALPVGPAPPGAPAAPGYDAPRHASAHPGSADGRHRPGRGPAGGNRGEPVDRPGREPAPPRRLAPGARSGAVPGLLGAPPAVLPLRDGAPHSLAA